MSEVYVLGKSVDESVLEKLNNPSGFKEDRLYYALGKDRWAALNEIEDWIFALKSGKKIVNPLSPREELEKTFKAAASYHEVSYCEGYKTGIETALSIIAKEHHDVADWLGDQDA